MQAEGLEVPVYPQGNTPEGKQTVTFRWITNIELTEKNLEEMVNAARGRWKIENEGFKTRKMGFTTSSI